jgi:hypothetical protein
MFYREENIPIGTGGSSAAAAIVARNARSRGIIILQYIGVIILFVWTNSYMYTKRQFPGEEYIKQEIQNGE